MALQKTCSSSSSSTQACTYDVFVSFYGKDTRLSFTDHLFAALKRSGIRTFRDDRELERGKAIWPELENAIETSRIAIIVFSTNYAASRWCLDELEKIMECNRSLQQIVLPIFYHVDPSELRAQKGNLAEVFAKHKERFGEEKVWRWRADLTEAASLSGWDLHNVAHRFESESIEKIIGYIFNKLNLEYIMVASYPVGLESRIQNLSKLLDKDSGDVCMVGIWGIGGIGKTTLAKAIYNQLQRKFQGSCFLEDVRAIAKQPNGLIDLQKKIRSSIHVNDTGKIELVDQGTMVIKNRAWCKRVLVVLDNVDHRDQLEKLAIRRDYFEPGSIIIITTRDKSMLKLAGVDENSIYVPQELDYHESLQLLSWHAFRKDRPNENFAELSKEVIYYAGGLPLVLEVVGSFLLDKSTNEWRGILEYLKVIPHAEIQRKLRVSYYSLSGKQQELFLDIACFFVGMEKNHIFKILPESDLVLASSLGVLVCQCLVTIDCSNRLRMHDMIRDMGREVVHTESKDPGKRSRLWFHEDVLDVLQNHMGTEVVEGIMLNLPGDNDLQVDSKAFARMDQLRVLQLNFVRLKGNFQCPSKRLRYLEWYGFPLKTIPSDLHMENLVAIYMPYSSLIELWTGTKILQKLKFLDVSHSDHLMRTPDFSGITNLEVLVLNNCTSLVEVHNSVVHLNKLVTLDLADCENLTKIPSGIDKLKSVNLSGCTKLDMVPRFEFPSPSTLMYSLCISSQIPLESSGFKINKFLQLNGLTVMDCASLVENREAITNVDDLATQYSDLENCDSLSATNLVMMPEISKPMATCASLVKIHEAMYVDNLATQYSDLENCDSLSATILGMMPEITKPMATLASLVEIHEAMYVDDLATHYSDLENCDCYLRMMPEKNKFINTVASLAETRKIIPCVDDLKHSRMFEVRFDSKFCSPRGLDLVKDFVCLPVVIFDFHNHLPILNVSLSRSNHLTILNVSLSRRFRSLDELPICLQAMAANNATSLEWMLTRSNLKISEQLIISSGFSKLPKKNHTSNPRKKLLKELIARDRFSVFLPAAEFPDWLDYNSTGSILSFIVPPVKQKIRGWFLCAVFASRFHDIYGFNVICKFKNNTKGTEVQFQQKKCHVIPCQEHLWLHSVPLHHVAHLLEAGDEVEYSIHVSGSFQSKKFGVNLVYENDKKDYQSYFEAMIQNASLPYKNDFLHEDVSTDQAMAGDQKIHPPYVQDQPSDVSKDQAMAGDKKIHPSYVQGIQVTENSPEMATELNDADDAKLWTPHFEKLFIQLMVDEMVKQNMPDGVFGKRTWMKILGELNERTKRNFKIGQVKAKFNRLRQKHRIFSQLLQHTGIGWDPETNTVTASDEVWMNVLAALPKAKEFRRKECDNYFQLGLLFNKTTATGVMAFASTQPPTDTDEERELDERFQTAGVHVTVDVDPVEGEEPDTVERDVDAISPEKRARSEERSKSKKSARKGNKVSEMADAINSFAEITQARFEAREARYARMAKTTANSNRNVGESNLPADECMLKKAIEVLDQYKDIPNEIFLKVMTALYNADNRVAFLALSDERRKVWMEYIGNL